MADNTDASLLDNGGSTYFSDQISRNQLIRDLVKGLSAMRGGKDFDLSGRVSRYLPKFDSEPDHIYNNRVARSYLTNYFKRAIQSDVGKVVSAPLGMKTKEETDLPDFSEAWFDDVDLEGKDINTFTKDELEEACYKGVSLVFVDFVNEEGFQRPFLHHIDIDTVTNFKSNRRTGQITELEWVSVVTADTEESGIAVKKARWVVRPTEWELYYIDEDDETPAESGEIVRYRKNKRIANELPISIMYTNKTGKLLARSPYETLAELTVEHFQVSSDIKNNLFYALTPFLFAKGFPEDVNIKALAAWQAVIIGDDNSEALPNIDVKWVQANAAPIKEGREQLKDLEYRISSFGIDASSIRPSGNQTATQYAINSAGSNAALLRFASALQNHIENIVRMMFSYLPSGAIDVTVELSSDFDVSDNNDKANTAITAAEKGIISPMAATEVMKQNNILGKDYDYFMDMASMLENSNDKDDSSESDDPVEENPDIIPQEGISEEDSDNIQ